MQAQRKQRLQSVIQDELSLVVSREVHDPRIPSVTFTQVTVSDDGSYATILVSILGGSRGGFNGAPPLSEGAAKQRMKECLQGLASASGFLRRHLAAILKVRHIPHLIFKEDRGLDNVHLVHDLLKQISSEPVRSEPDSAQPGLTDAASSEAASSDSASSEADAAKPGSSRK